MKTLKYSFFNSFMILLGVSLLFLGTSCDTDDEVVDGVPNVERIRPVDPDLADESLDKVGLGENIVIVGNNMKSIKEVYVNGYKTFFSPTMVTNTHMVLSISDETPTVATAPDVSNEIRMVSYDGGETIYAVTILPPAPSVEKISNEFAKAGETLHIHGQYFFFIEEVEFPGGVIATDVETSSDGRSMQVVVPQGIDEAGTLSVTTESGSGVLSPMYRFNDYSGMVNNFDDMDYFGAWGPKPVLGNSDPAPIDGNYVRVTGEDIPAPMWWNNDQVVPMEGVQWPVSSGDASDYAIKFEVNTPVAWNSGWFEFNFGWTYFYVVKPWDVNPDEDEYWTVSGTRTPTPENEWFTIVIPLNKFRLKPDLPDGDPIQSVSELEGKDMVLAFQNPGDPRGHHIDELHICMDNFRLVKITE